MPIEFSCTACGKLLRTPDETAGRQAKCPACGAVTSVPAREFVPAEATPFDAVAESMEAPGEEYQSPADEAGSPFASTVPPIERVRWPAICLIVIGSLRLLADICITAFFGFGFVGMLNGPQFQGRPEDAIPGIIMMAGVSILGIIMAILVIVGGVKMKNLRSYGLAMTGAIVMLISWCLSPCGIGIIGFPFGIWALVVLLNGDVRAAFR